MKLKKLLASILCAAMVLSTMSFTVFAAETTVSAADDLFNTILNAQPGDVINLGQDINYEGTWGEVWNKKDLTINGNGYTLSVASIDTGINGGGLFLDAENLTINDLTVYLPEHTKENPRLATMKSGTLNNVTVIGGTHGVSVKGDVTINNCTFEDQSGWTVETESAPGTASLTITDCTFEDNAVILRGENNTFTDNKITGEGEGVNVLGDAVITGNDFGESSLGIDSGVEIVIENNVINNVELSTWLVPKGEEADYTNVTVENNTLSEEALEDLKAIDEDVVSVDPVAEVNGKKYYTFEEAISAADGAEITLFANAELNNKLNNATININLNGYTLYVNAGANYLVGNNSVSNGTIDISNASASQNIFGLAQYVNQDTTMTMDNVNFVGDGYNSGYAVFEIGNSGAQVALTVTNSTIDLKNDNADQGGFVKGNSADDAFILANSTVILDNTDMFAVNVDADFDTNKITIANLTDVAFRNFGGTVDNTTITVTNSANGIRNTTADYDLEINNSSSVKISDSTNTEAGKTGDLVLSAGCVLAVDETSELLVETSSIADDSDVSGNVVSKADTIYVQFKEVTENVPEGEMLYDIVLVGADGETINRLNSADLTFDFESTPVNGGSMAYAIEKAEDITLTTDSDYADRYMFNFEGKTDVEDTDTELVIGQVRFTGYGTFSFSVDTTVTYKNANVVNATTISDNIVDTFVIGGGEGLGTLVVNEEIEAEGEEDDGMAGKIDGETISVPTRALTIDVTFPNAVTDQTKAYQAMTVTISGGDLAADITANLGTDEKAMENGKYTVTADLTRNIAYNITVKGAGYRTARYTVTMTDDKTVTFWNNVMDDNKAMEVNEVTAEEKGAAKLNFLAGDIVADNNINIYDLSAVVSYFATANDTSAYSDYAKYDLNRDGVIDSKDVAYVLVSWNN